MFMHPAEHRSSTIGGGVSTQTAQSRCRFLFVGSSILLIYDNDNAAPHSRWARALERATQLRPDSYAALRRKTRVNVRMIDFAHAGPLPSGQRRDHGYITGLKTIIDALGRVTCAAAAAVLPRTSWNVAICSRFRMNLGRFLGH